jgi:hypothetical protein
VCKRRMGRQIYLMADVPPVIRLGSKIRAQSLPHAADGRFAAAIRSRPVTGWGRYATDLSRKTSHRVQGPVVIRSGLRVCPLATVQIDKADIEHAAGQPRSNLSH